MQSQVFFYVDMQGKGKGPLPLHSIPKTNNNSKTKSNNKTKTKTKNKIKVVYTEDLTHPERGLPLQPAVQRPRRLRTRVQHRFSAQQSLRQRQGTFLAAGLHQPR